MYRIYPPPRIPVTTRFICYCSWVGYRSKNLSFIFHWWAGKHQNIHIGFVTPQKPIPKKEFTEIPLNVLHISTSIMCLFICIYIIYIYIRIYIHKKTCPCHHFLWPRDPNLWQSKALRLKVAMHKEFAPRNGNRAVAIAPSAAIDLSNPVRPRVDLIHYT